MVVYHDVREILAIMALIGGFSIALLVLPNAMHVSTQGAPSATLPPAQPGSGVEKIPVSVHTIFAS